MCVYIYIHIYIYIHGALDVSRSRTTTQHSRYDSSGRVISLSQRPLPDNTQHSQQTNIHAPSGIRTHDLSRRAIADLRLRPHGHWDRSDTVRTHRNYIQHLGHLTSINLALVIQNPSGSCIQQLTLRRLMSYIYIWSTHS